MKKIIFFFIFIVFVFPNAFRPIKYFLVVLITFYIYNTFREVFFKKYKTFLFLGFSLSVFYIAFGHFFATQPYISFFQCVAVYIAFPLFWIYFSDYILQKYSPEYIIKLITILGVVGCATIFIAIWLLENNYVAIMEYVIDNPKASKTSEGATEVRMNVYGSLLFFIPAILSSFKRLSTITKIVLFFIIFISVFNSGRSILLASIVVGVLGYLHSLKNGFKIILVLFVGAMLINFLISYFNIPVLAIFKDIEYKLTGEGGDDNFIREYQFWMFLEGIEDYYYLFGHGHGVGIDLVRNPRYNWRSYELLIMATIYRVGVIGFIIYALPFIYCVKEYVKLSRKKRNTYVDDFFIFGVIGIIVGVFSNPYLESFDFQFGFFLSFCYFINRDSFYLKKINYRT